MIFKGLFMTNKQIIFNILDKLKEGTYYGWELENIVHTETLKNNKRPYVSTILSYTREYCSISGATFNCIDRNKSLYEYKQGYKISGAIID